MKCMNIFGRMGALILLVVAVVWYIGYVLVAAFEEIYTFFIMGLYLHGALLLLFLIGANCIIIGCIYEILKPDDDHDKYIPFDF